MEDLQLGSAARRSRRLVKALEETIMTDERPGSLASKAYARLFYGASAPEQQQAVAAALSRKMTIAPSASNTQPSWRPAGAGKRHGRATDCVACGLSA
jgi:hypothetical protein